MYFSFYLFQRLIYLEAERVRKEEEARLRKKLGAKKAAEAAEKLAQVCIKNIFDGDDLLLFLVKVGNCVI